MSVIMEVAKQSGSPRLIMKEDYNSLDFSEKLQCLVSIRTAIEKEIAFTEKDFRRFVNKRRF
jgi:hypothetical protein|tara:strand:+ start:66 stop:251 length:186 start_codon:yes stop_codon:yes gene_type:complete